MIRSSHWNFDKRIEDLLLQWSERQEAEEDVSLEELCAGQTELIEPLREAIRTLESTQWMLDSAESPPSTPGTHAELHPPFLNIQFTRPFSEILGVAKAFNLISEADMQRGLEICDEQQPAECVEFLIQQGMTWFQLNEIDQGQADDLVLGDYVLLDLVAAGGMGEVYRARHRPMNRIVALKLMKPQLFNAPQATARFLREVRIAAKLVHPNIVTAYDAGEDQGRLYLAMEFVDGTDLGTLVTLDGPLNIDQTLNYIRQAATGLAYAHEHGVIHRDVKPWNLLLDRTGTVKVLDLGLAREVSDGNLMSLTTESDVMGTVDFIAPEQAQDVHAADERSDVYSLGCTLYTLLHGQPVFDGATPVNRLLGHLSAVIPVITAGQQELPMRLQHVFSKMVEKNPARRYQTMQEVIAALETLPYAGTDHKQSERRQASPRRRKHLWVAVALSAMAGLLVTFHFLGIFVPTAADQAASSRIDVPSGEVVSDEPDLETKPIKPTPPTVRIPFGIAEAQAEQLQWSEFLDMPIVLTNSLNMQFMLIPPGEYEMGTDPKEMARWIKPEPEGSFWKRMFEAEAHPHLVQITSPFYLGKFEITQRDYENVMHVNPSHFHPNASGAKLVADIWTDEFPVETVDWSDAVRFCNRLSGFEAISAAYMDQDGIINMVRGDGYRLPTEAEWEWACRSGSSGDVCVTGSSTTPYAYGWIRGTADSRTYQVGLKPANAFGLHDSIGNVSEWVWDNFDEKYYWDSPVIDPSGPASGTDKVVRGGNWNNGHGGTRSGARAALRANKKVNAIGFRVALPIEGARLILSRSLRDNPR